MRKKNEMSYQKEIAENIRKILKDRGMKQVDLVDEDAIKEHYVSRTLNGRRTMLVDDLAVIARALGVRVVDLITYPEVYQPVKEKEAEPVEAILQIKLMKDKKDQVLKLVFGENNIEILNK